MDHAPKEDWKAVGVNIDPDRTYQACTLAATCTCGSPDHIWVIHFSAGPMVKPVLQGEVAG